MAIASLRQRPRLADQPPNARAHRVGTVVPVLGDTPRTEERCPDLALARPVAKRVVDPQQLNPSCDPGVTGEQRASEPAIAMKVKETAQRQYPGLRRAKAVQAIMQMDDPLARQLPSRDIEANVAMAVRQDRVVMPLQIGGDIEPGRDPLKVETIGIATGSRHSLDA